jgi:hypothetical protein
MIKNVHRLKIVWAPLTWVLEKSLELPPRLDPLNPALLVTLSFARGGGARHTAVVVSYFFSPPYDK